MDVYRKICPIGQGAFYTERLNHENADSSVIFDCGSFGSGHEGMVRKGQNGNYIYEVPMILKEWINSVPITSIDYIFISHLHWDHINGIKSLLDMCYSQNHYPTIVMPYIEKNIIFSYFVEMLVDSGIGNAISGKIANDNINQIKELLLFYKNLFYEEKLENNKKLIVRDTAIITYNNENHDNKFYNILHTDDIADEKIKVRIRNTYWSYIAIKSVDPQLEKYAKEMINQIKDLPVQDDLIQIIQSGKIEKISSSNWAKIEKIVLNINKKYGKYLNDMSMMLYSGTKLPTRIRFNGCCQKHSHWCFCHNSCICGDINHCHYKSGAFYSGDITKNDAWSNIETNLLQRFNLHSNIGLYQISHHGHGNAKSEQSTNKFNLEMPEHISPRFAFCCFGTKNSYYHPDYRLLQSYWQENINTIAIDEESSAFSQHIRVIV